MSKGISDALITMLGEADKRNGLPPGTMFSVMQQESGGQSKFLDDPTAYHYGLNAEGKRIAGHTGKVSTAFGPFGILESTGAKPGYGVAPLKDKSIEEQVRFASDYLAARSKQGGSLQAGLSGYGEGDKYSKQVMSRVNPTEPVTVASAPIQEQNSPAIPVAVQEQSAPVVQLAQAAAPTELQIPPSNPTWEGLPQTVDLVGVPTMASMNYGDMFPQQAMPKVQPNFQAFGKWGKQRV